MALAAACSYLGASIAFDEASAIAWSGVSLSLVGFAAYLGVTRGGQRSLAELRLGAWFAAGFAVTFGTASVVLAYSGAEQVKGLREYVTGDLAVEAAPILMAFMGCVAIAYRGFPTEWTTAIRGLAARQAGAESSSYGAPILVLLIGLSAQLSLFRAGTLGYGSDVAALNESAGPFTNILSSFAEFTTFAVFWMAWRLAETRHLRAGLLLATALAADFAVGLISGMKESAAMALLAAVFGWAGARRRTNWVGSALFAVIFVIVVYPTITQYREAISIQGGRLTGVEAASRLDLGARSPVDATVGEFSARLARLPDLTVITSQTPEVIYYRDVTDLFAAPALGVIPRAVWPDKPVMSTGYGFAIEYYGQDASFYSSSAVTPEGDLYRHGGILMVLVGGLAMGLILRAADSVSEGSRDPRFYFLAVSVFPMVVKHEIDFIGFVASWPTAVVSYWVAVRISRARLPRQVPQRQDRRPTALHTSGAA